MQRPTDNLRADHRLAAQAQAVLGEIAVAVRAGEPFPTADCATLIRFLREFVLGVHMRKETEMLCPAAAMRADDHAASVVGELTRLQSEVADLTHALLMFWEPIGELTEAERAGFAATVEELVTRLGYMQQIEENDLFPACDGVVPADDQLSWIDRFAELERERGSRQTWALSIAALAERWLP